MGNETDYNTFRLAYSEIGGMRPIGRAQSVQAEILKRMESTAVAATTTTTTTATTTPMSLQAQLLVRVRIN